MSPAQRTQQHLPQPLPPARPWPLAGQPAQAARPEADTVQAALDKPAPALRPTGACTWAAALLERCVALAGPRARQAGASLVPPVVEDGLALMAPGRPLQLVMTALLRTAVDHSSNGGAVHVRAIRQGGRACLTVLAEGRALRPGSAEAPSLLSTRTRLQRLGGSLQLDQPGGSCRAFHVWLPLARNDPRHPAPT